MKVWITKYALTKGVLEREVEICPTATGMVACRDPEFRGEFYSGEGKNWHRTKESAVKRAFEMRDAKLSSLVKQMDRLKKLQFS